MFLKGNRPTQIKDELDSVYGDSASSFTIVKLWADDERSGRPKTPTTEDNIAKVHQMVLDYRRIKMREISEVMKMPKDLGMRKLHTRWVLPLLT